MAKRQHPPRPGQRPPRRGSRPGGPAPAPARRSTADARRRGEGARSHAAETPPPSPHQANPRAVPDGPERLQKVLAHAGVGSRRACEDLILQGRVTIDGQVVRELGTRVDPWQAKVAVDGEPIHEERHVYYAVHKPKGYVSTTKDPAGRPKVLDLLPEVPQRVYTVGRLDEQSTGLMLLTNDGELANRLAHPKFGVEKLYRVVVAGEPGREVFDKLTEGVWLAEGKVRAKRVRPVARRGQATVLEMTLAEGKNREIRRMLARLGHKVMSLTRIAVGPIVLKGLGVGECRPLSGREVDLLRKVAAGEYIPTPRDADRRPRTPRPATGRPGAPPPPGGPAGGIGPRTSGAPGRPARPRPAVPPEGMANQNQRGRGGRPQGPRPSGPAPIGGPPEHGHGRPLTRADQTPIKGPRVAGSAPPPKGRPPRPSGPPPRVQAQRRPEGLPPVVPSGPGGPPPSRKKPARTAAPERRIIGLDLGPAESAGPPGPRLKRPGPRRSPRAALGVKRAKKPPTGQEEGT